MNAIVTIYLQWTHIHQLATCRHYMVRYVCAIWHALTKGKVKSCSSELAQCHIQVFTVDSILHIFKCILGRYLLQCLYFHWSYWLQIPLTVSYLILNSELSKSQLSKFKLAGIILIMVQYVQLYHYFRHVLFYNLYLIFCIWVCRYDFVTLSYFYIMISPYKMGVCLAIGHDQGGWHPIVCYISVCCQELLHDVLDVTHGP